MIRHKCKHKILCQSCLSVSIKRPELKWPRARDNLGKYIDRPSRTAYSIVSGGIKRIQVFLPTRMKKIKLKMKTPFSHCKSIVIIPDTQGQLTPHSQVRAGRKIEIIQAIMLVLIT